MPNETPSSPDPSTPPILVAQPDPGQPPVAYSPSPVPGTPSPKRRRADQPGEFTVQWTVLWGALLMWAISFMQEMARLPWAEIQTHQFIFEHVAQILGVIAAVVFAKRIP